MVFLQYRIYHEQKRIDSDQPARTVQADLNQFFFADAFNLFFTEYNSFLIHQKRKRNFPYLDATLRSPLRCYYICAIH